jgi:hypothetical protein
MVKKKQLKTSKSTMRWFRRSNVYIAEYILMLVVTGAMISVLSSLYYATLQLTYTSGYEASSLVESITMQLAVLLIVAPAAYWLYARVTGQEMIEPTLYASKVRTVFLSLWMIPLAAAFLVVSISVVHAILSMIVDQSSDVLSLVVGTVLPGVLTLATIGFGLFMVVKRVKRKFTMMSGIVVSAVVAIVASLSLVTILMNRDVEIKDTNDCEYGSLQTFRTCDDAYPRRINDGAVQSPRQQMPNHMYPSSRL